MVGLNHAISGALIAVAVDKPAIALPAALLSHFALDATPHWNYGLKRPFKQLAMVLDLTFSLSILLVLSATLDDSARLIIAGVFLGMLPDAMWLPAIARGEASAMNKNTPLHFLRRLHRKLQWCEVSWGWVVEAIWLVGTVIILLRIN